MLKICKLWWTRLFTWLRLLSWSVTILFFLDLSCVTSWLFLLEVCFMLFCATLLWCFYLDFYFCKGFWSFKTYFHLIKTSIAHVTMYAKIDTSTSIYNTISHRISKHMIYRYFKWIEVFKIRLKIIMVRLYQGASNIYQYEGDPNSKNTLPPNRVVT